MLAASCVIQAITFDVMIDAEEDCECIIIGANAFNDISEKYI
jgi:CRP/FNR family transcriptional regulator